MNEGWSKDLNEKELEDELTEAMAAARAWMEINPEKHLQHSAVEVGETVLLTVKATLPGKLPLSRFYKLKITFKFQLELGGE